MGKTTDKFLNKFESKDVENKQLVIEMLKYEEMITFSDMGQSLYKNTFNMPLTSLCVEKSLNRLTLKHFGYDTSDDNVEMYRKIFSHYFNSPLDYDKDVINSIHYMRENKCVFYKLPRIEIGSVIPLCDLYDHKTESKYELHNILKDNKPSCSIIAAYSLS